MAIFKWKKVAGKKPSVETTEIEVPNDRDDGSGTRGIGEEMSPKPLSSKGYAYWTVFVFDILLSLVPVGFIVLAALALTLQNQPKSPKGEKIVRATLLSPTLFPIIYAAVVGKLLRRIGLYKAERGTKLRTLERLMGSHSVSTAIERQIGLRTLDPLGIFLIILWLLSPLGGQASLRLLSTTPRVVPINDTFRYFPIEGYWTTYLMSQEMILNAWPRYAPLYMTNLHLARTYMDKPMDLWGAVKIPDIKYANTTLMEGGWRSIDHSSNTTYASLFGLPISGIPDTGNTTFNMSSHYWSVECDDIYTGSRMKWNGSRTNEEEKWYSFRLNMSSLEDPVKPQDPQMFTYISLTEPPVEEENYTAAVSMTNCVTRPVYVESLVSCIGRDCGVNSMREYNRTGFAFPKWSFRNLASSLPGVDIGMPQLRRVVSGSELTERWIINPQTTFDDKFISDVTEFADIASLSREDFSKRLQMVVNTYWDATVGARYRTTNITLDKDGEVCADCNVPPSFFNTTKVNGVTFEGEKYVCSVTFVVLTIVISWILFMSATISVVLAAGLIKAPDILGYISTYLRDNRYAGVAVPSNIDGLDTARLFGDMVVAVGDVKGENEIGHVSFGSTDTGIRRLNKERLYD